MAPNIATFLLARALDGIANGLVLVPLYVLAATLVHPNRRADMFALFSAAWVLPSLVGPVLAGFASQAWGWRATYLALGIIFLPVLLFATR
ncbi:MFS transporter, partial [Bacillus cereus]|uniref:MFS transporter n=1 Tax=Bacillus cereus TaxID=1396 RepID=UPI0034D95662